MIFPEKKILFLNGILLAILLAHSVYRDIQLENHYPGDLRNRIVGARLQKDGKLPYRYHWKAGEGIRYYNPDEDVWLSPDGNRQDKIPADSDINKITASPFFHELLYPICDLPQRTISRIWFWGQYIMLAVMIGMISGLAKNRGKKWLLLNIGILFTATEAWKNLISAGQIYLLEGFLICCILTALVRQKKYEIILGGICAALFVLTRPIAIILFIPFLFDFKKWLPFLATAFSGLALYLLFVIINPNETALYKEYLNAMNMQVQLHQDANDGLPPRHMESDSKFSNIEGFDLTETKRLGAAYPVKIDLENGNIFVVYYRIFHKKLPLAVLNAGFVFTVLQLSILFFLYNRKEPRLILQILLFSFTLYMIAELFSPVYRRQYNIVQWFPLVMAGFLLLQNAKNPAFILLILGLLMNIGNFKWFPMRHTFGEFCWLSALLNLVFSSRYNQTEWKKQL